MWENTDVSICVCVYTHVYIHESIICPLPPYKLAQYENMYLA